MKEGAKLFKKTARPEQKIMEKRKEITGSVPE
jgi:hypothetical protein